VLTISSPSAQSMPNDLRIFLQDRLGFNNQDGNVVHAQVSQVREALLVTSKILGDREPKCGYNPHWQCQQISMLSTKICDVVVKCRIVSCSKLKSRG
jgi:hypothetical protein